MKKILAAVGILLLFTGCGSPTVQTQKLGNGAKLIAVSLPHAPVITLQAWFHVGARNEPAGWGGASHFLEHLLFKRGRDPSSGSLAARVESHGGEFNAATSHDFTYFYINIPPEHFSVALESLRTALQEPSYTPADFAAEKKVILAEMAHRHDDPWTLVYDKLLASLFPEHPYGRRVIGEGKTVAAFTGLQIAEYYRQQYRPDRLVFVMAGPLDHRKALHQAEQALMHFPTSPFRVEQAPSPPKLLTQSAWKISKENVSQEYFAIGWLGPPAENQDAIPLDLLAALLAGGRSSKLNRELVEKERLAHRIQAGFFTMKDAGIFVISGTALPENHSMLTKRIQEEIASFRNQPLPLPEIQRAQTALETDYFQKHETSSGFAQAVGSAAVISTIEDDLKYLQKIQSVTPRQLQELAERYLGFSTGVAVIPK